MHEHQAALFTEDERKFLADVQNSLGNADRKLADDPALLDKLTRAYREAKCLGLSQDELLADFLYLEMQAPGFHRHPAIRGWLHQPGAASDDRFADLVDVLRKKSQQLKENQYWRRHVALASKKLARHSWHC